MKKVWICIIICVSILISAYEIQKWEKQRKIEELFIEATDRSSDREAVEIYDEILEIEPDNPYAWYEKGNLHKWQFELNEAMGCYDNAIKYLEMIPENVPYFFDIGSTYRALGREDLAIECFEKVLKISPDSIGAECTKGQIYSRDLKEYDKAIECYDLAIARIFCDKGFVYYHDLKEYSKAIECYDKALEIVPDCFEAWLGNAYAYRALGREDLAIECFEKVVEIEPDTGYYWNELAELYRSIGDEERAEYCKEMVVKLDMKEDGVHEERKIL